LRILLYEHVSSGGYAGEPLPSSLFCEGYSMLRGLTPDFKAAGHEVTVLLDSRIASFNPHITADHIVKIDSCGETDQAMDFASRDVDAAYVVAPESSHVLQSIVECIETTGTLSLNCQSFGIECVSNKARIGEQASNLGLQFPKTETFNIRESPLDIAREIDGKLNFPVVIKPEDGAGCGGLSIAKSKEDINKALRKIREETASPKVAVQEQILGIPASVSLICTGKNALPVSLNLQNISLAGPEGFSTYEGGSVPIEHPLKQIALWSAKHLVESFEGLRGYVGVDLVLSNEKAYIMEVNPRLTTSYVGLRKVVNFNVAQAIVDAVVRNVLPENLSLRGVCCFSKVATRSPQLSVQTSICNSDWLVTPPFILNPTEISYSMVQSYRETVEEAFISVDEVKKRLQRICAGEE
jgi:tyramine---L-glutamate ligase